MVWPRETRSPRRTIFVSSSRIPRVPAVLAPVLRVLLAFAAASAGAVEAGALNPRFTGLPFARTWLAQDYAGSPTNRGVLQHPQTGLMYFANAGGVLEFDGARWRLYRAPGFNGINTLAVDARGRVWFSTDQQVGFLSRTAQGELEPVSALDQLPPEERAIFPLGRCVATNDGVYFAARDRVVRFSVEPGGRARVWRFPGGELAPHVWLMDGVVHVRGPSSVWRLRDDGFHEVDELKTFSFATRSTPEGGWQMINRDGLRRWENGYQPIAPGRPAVMSALGNDTALCATFLHDGRIAYGTTRSGLILCDRLGQRLQAIDRSHGLLSNRVEALCEDHEGGLWATFRNGIMRLQVDSPFARHGTGDHRIDTTPTALALHGGNLFVGGGEGLWRRDDAGDFHAIHDVPQYVRSLVSLDGQLYATGIELRRIQPDDTAELLDTTYYGLVALSNAPGVLVHGTNDGLAFSRREAGRWVSAGRHAAITGTTAAVCEWPAGVIWAAAHNRGVWRVDFRGGLRADAPAKLYDASNPLLVGVTQYNVHLVRWAGGFGGSIGNRLVRYDETAERFVAETRIRGLPLSGGSVALAPIGVRTGVDDTLWLQTLGGAVVHVVRAGADGWRAEESAGPRLTQMNLTTLLPDEANHTLWLAGGGALVSRDLAWRPNGRPAPLAAMVRRVETAAGKVLFGGWSDSLNGGGPALVAAPPASRGEHRNGLPASGSPTKRVEDHALHLEPTQTALRFLYAAPSYGSDYLGRPQFQFRTRLDGLDTDWSAWSGETQRDFTNLPYRDFVFRVEARDDQGRTSPAAEFAFSIAPPWWLTRAMFAGYGVLALAGIAGLVRWRTHALRQRAARLETVVAARTEELRASNQELARLHAVERDEKLAARLDEEKARLEVLRYQLNPHFLYNSLASICGTARSNPEATRTMAQRLADFCRLTLTRADETESVREELRMLQAYLDIEKTRWRDNLQIEIDVDDAALDHRLPTFLLLPLLENAIKHGGQTTRGVLHVRLAIYLAADGGLAIEVANTGTWDTTTPKPNSTGIGLENMRRRLKRFYPDAHELTIAAKDGWVSVTLRVFQRTEDGERKTAPKTH